MLNYLGTRISLDEAIARRIDRDEGGWDEGTWGHGMRGLIN